MKLFKFSLTNLSFFALNLCTLNLCAMEEVYYKNPFFKSSVFISSAEKLYIVNNENCMENLKDEEFLKLLTTPDREGDLFDILENIILKNSNLIKYVPKLLNRYLEENPIEAKRIKIFQLFLTTFVKENNASCINYIMKKISDLDAPLVLKILSQDFEKFLYNNAFRKAFLNFLFLQEKKEYEDFIYSFIFNLINYQSKFNLYSPSSIELYLEYWLIKPLKYKSVFLTVMNPISVTKNALAPFYAESKFPESFLKKFDNYKCNLFSYIILIQNFVLVNEFLSAFLDAPYDEEMLESLFASDNYGNSSLFLALMTGKKEKAHHIEKVLLQNLQKFSENELVAQNLFHANTFGYTPFRYAFESADYEAMEILIKLIFKLNSKKIIEENFGRRDEEGFLNQLVLQNYTHAKFGCFQMCITEILNGVFASYDKEIWKIVFPDPKGQSFFNLIMKKSQEITDYIFFMASNVNKPNIDELLQILFGPDAYGNTALHMAVLENKEVAFDNILTIACTLKYMSRKNRLLNILLKCNKEGDNIEALLKKNTVFTEAKFETFKAARCLLEKESEILLNEDENIIRCASAYF